MEKYEESNDTHALALRAQSQFSDAHELMVIPSITMAESNAKERIQDLLSASTVENVGADASERDFTQLNWNIPDLANDARSAREALYTHLVFALIGLILFTVFRYKTAALIWILTPFSIFVPSVFGHSHLINDNATTYYVAIPIFLSGVALLTFSLKNKKAVVTEA